MRVANASRRPSRWWTAALTAVVVMMAGTSVVRATEVPPPPPPAPDCGNAGAANTHAARAYSLSLAASLLGINIGIPPVPDTGELPPGGGHKDATLVTIDGVALPVPLPKPVSLSARILHNTTFGSGNTSTAYSSVTDLNLAITNGLTQLLSVSAGVLTAQSTVKCVAKTRTVDSARTGSKIAKLVIKIMGVPIVIPAEAPANTKIALPQELALLAKGGIVLNEQIPSNGRQVVNAVHIKLEVLGAINAAKIDLIISHAEANTTCGNGSDPDSCTCKARDFVTGGGQFPTDDKGGTATFSINGRSQDSVGPNGHLNIVDHQTRAHIRATTLVDYDATGENARKLTFSDCSSSLGGYPQTCWVDIEDNATSGGGKDKFGASPYYGISEILHGNIVLHRPNCGGASSGGGGGSGGGGKGKGRK